MSHPLIVGIDPHRRQNVVQMMDNQGHLLDKAFRVDNNRPGTERFIEQVVEQAAAGPFDAIEMASEATGWYWFHCFQMLSQDPQLNQWPLQLYAFIVSLDYQSALDRQVQGNLRRPGQIRSQRRLCRR